jgi:hypothetical protein
MRTLWSGSCTAVTPVGMRGATYGRHGWFRNDWDWVATPGTWHDGGAAGTAGS